MVKVTQGEEVIEGLRFIRIEEAEARIRGEVMSRDSKISRLTLKLLLTAKERDRYKWALESIVCREGRPEVPCNCGIPGSRDHLNCIMDYALGVLEDEG